MLKARMGKTILLGLTEENIKRLKEGHPIHINQPEFGEIAIFYGATETELQQEIKPLLGPNTIIKNDTGGVH